VSRLSAETVMSIVHSINRLPRALIQLRELVRRHNVVENNDLLTTLDKSGLNELSPFFAHLAGLFTSYHNHGQFDGSAQPNVQSTLQCLLATNLRI
jgi:hypothetical protein